MLVVKIQIAVAKPPQKEDISRLVQSTLNQQIAQPPPPAPPSSPLPVRLRRGRVLHRRASSFVPSESRRLHPDSQVVTPAASIVKSRTASGGHLLDAMTIKPVLRGRDQSSAADRLDNDWEDLDMEIELPVASPRRELMDQCTSSLRTPTHPLEMRTDSKSSWTVGATGKRPLTTEPTYSVQQLNFYAPCKDNDDRCSTHSSMKGRGLYVDGPKQPTSLPRPMALRRNRSENSTIIRGLPSKTAQTRSDGRLHQQLQATSRSSQLPEVSSTKLLTVRHDIPGSTKRYRA